MVMKQKVSQATIDKIKKMGMTKALKSASKASPEMKEGLRRMYGARRLAEATKPMQQTARTAERNTPMKSRETLRTADRKTPSKTINNARIADRKTPAKSSTNPRIADRNTPVAKKAAAKPMAKKSGTTDPFAKAVFGIGRAITSGQGAQRMTAAQVAAENKRRAAAAKKK
jgi:hypothetical protein